jgi:hypothetical protein
MGNESGEIGQQQIKSVIAETGIKRVTPDVAFKAVGKQRPNATFSDFDERWY